MNNFLKMAVTELPKTLRSAPIEFALGLIYFLILPSPLFTKDLQVYHMLYFAVSLLIVHSVNTITLEKGRAFYFLSALIPVSIAVLIEYMQPDNLSASQLVITLLCSVLFYIAMKRASNNEEFVTNAVHTFTNIGVAMLVGFITFIVIGMLLLPVHIFADLDSSDSVFVPVMEFIYLVLAPVIFLILERVKGRKPLTNVKFIDTMVNKVFSPLILAYGLILYIYFVKILREWELPNGVIAKLVLILMTVGVIVQIGRTIVPKTVFKGIFKYFGYLSIPAIVMMLVSIAERIEHLGLTGNRVYLILTIITIALWCAAMVIPKLNKYKTLVFVTVSMFVIFTYMPYVGYSNIEEIARKNEVLMENAKANEHVGNLVELRDETIEEN